MKFAYLCGRASFRLRVAMSRKDLVDFDLRHPGEDGFARRGAIQRDAAAGAGNRANDLSALDLRDADRLPAVGNIKVHRFAGLFHPLEHIGHGERRHLTRTRKSVANDKGLDTDPPNNRARIKPDETL